MAVKTIQNEGDFKRGMRGYLVVLLKQHASAQDTRSVLLAPLIPRPNRQKSSSPSSQSLNHLLSTIKTIGYKITASVQLTVALFAARQIANSARAYTLPLPHTFCCCIPPRKYFPKFHERLSNVR